MSFSVSELHASAKTLHRLVTASTLLPEPAMLASAGNRNMMVITQSAIHLRKGELKGALMPTHVATCWRIAVHHTSRFMLECRKSYYASGPPGINRAIYVFQITAGSKTTTCDSPSQEIYSRPGSWHPPPSRLPSCWWVV